MDNFFKFIKNIYVETYEALTLQSDTKCILLGIMSVFFMIFMTKACGAVTAMFIVLLFWILVEVLYMILPTKIYSLGKFKLFLPNIKLLFQGKIKFCKDMKLYRLPKEQDLYVVYGAGSIGWFITVLF